MSVSLRASVPVFALSLVFLCSLCAAEYEIQSPYLLDPSLNIGYIDSCAQFWLSSYDQTGGGFYTDVGREGNPEGGSGKNTLTQCRNTFAMTRAFMVTGNEDYLTYARGALNFMYDHCWDTQYGGWASQVDASGNATTPGNKDFFWEFYALQGILSMYETTAEEGEFQWINTAWELWNSHMWDSRPGYLGYFSRANRDWSNPQGKGFGPTGDALNTHAVNIYLTTGESRHYQRLEQIGDNIVDHLVGNMDLCAVGFPELFDNDWSPTSDRNLWVGHLIKTAWCLARVHVLIPKQSYYDGVMAMIHDAWNNGAYDHTVGAPNKHANSGTGEITDQQRDWWTLEQAVNAGLIGYYISGDSVALRMADETIDFYMQHQVDHVYGEVWDQLSPDGSSPINTRKGHQYKAGYHSVELGYLAYLYGNLLIHEQPVTLYYRFYPATADREIKLWPIAIEDDRLVLSEVLKDGSPFGAFDSVTRTLSIGAGEDGVFAATFLPVNGSPSAAKIARSDMPATDITVRTHGGVITLQGLRARDNCDLAVFRADGSLILSASVGLSETFRLPLSTLGDGVFMVRLSGSGFRKTIPVVARSASE